MSWSELGREVFWRSVREQPGLCAVCAALLLVLFGFICVLLYNACQNYREEKEIRNRTPEEWEAHRKAFREHFWF